MSIPSRYVERCLNELEQAWAERLKALPDEWLAQLAVDLVDGRAPTVELPDGFPYLRDCLAARSLLLEVRRRIEVAQLEGENFEAA